MYLASMFLFITYVFYFVVGDVVSRSVANYGNQIDISVNVKVFDHFTIK